MPSVRGDHNERDGPRCKATTWASSAPSDKVSSGRYLWHANTGAAVVQGCAGRRREGIRNAASYGTDLRAYISRRRFDRMSRERIVAAW